MKNSESHQAAEPTAVAKSKDRWISKLSGQEALLSLENRKAIDCADSQAKCAKNAANNEVSIVGVVIKSQPDKSSVVPATMRGEIHTGGQLTDSPAVYVD